MPLYSNGTTYLLQGKDKSELNSKLYDTYNVKTNKLS